MKMRLSLSLRGDNPLTKCTRVDIKLINPPYVRMSQRKVRICTQRTDDLMSRVTADGNGGDFENGQHSLYACYCNSSRCFDDGDLILCAISGTPIIITSQC